MCSEGRSSSFALMLNFLSTSHFFHKLRLGTTLLFSWTCCICIFADIILHTKAHSFKKSGDILKVVNVSRIFLSHY
uniref:Uncharacterized protein n=1 Tax=Anguilla anguilla TaxID=7936 RepID=A0A0E9QLG9_ANGAN